MKIHKLEQIALFLAGAKQTIFEGTNKSKTSMNINIKNTYTEETNV